MGANPCKPMLGKPTVATVPPSFASGWAGWLKRLWATVVNKSYEISIDRLIHICITLHHECNTRDRHG